MTESERDEMVRLAEADYREAERLYHQRVEAAHWMYQKSQKLQHDNAVLEGAAMPRTRARSTAKREVPPVVAAMRQTLPKMEGAFDRVRLAERIKRDFPKLEKLDPSYLRVRLTALAKNGTIKVVRPGGGKAHTEYEYVGGEPVKSKRS